MTEGPRTIFEEAQTIVEEARTVFEMRAPAPSSSGLTTFRGNPVVKEFPARGGESDIFLVERGNEQLILKLYRLGMEPSEEVLRRIMTLCGQFPEHLVLIREFGFDDDTRRWFELQEYAADGSLREFLSGGSSPSLAMPAVREIAAGLAILHCHNLLHLDLKPSNVLVRSRVPLRLAFTDFGVSSVLDPELSRKLTTVKGTPHYWAPESITGVVGKEADYWGLGMIVLELLLGSHPFAGIDTKVIMYTLATRGIDIPAGIDTEYLPLLQGLLTREPHMRWGEEEVGRWLAGERSIPVHYKRQEQAGKPAAAPYTFMGEEFSSMKVFVGRIATDSGVWKEIWNHLDGKRVENWLNNCGDYDGSVLVEKIRENSAGNRELAILRLVYTFDPTLPFALYGKLITLGNLRLFAGRFLERSGDETEEAIVDDLIKGNLLRCYREYLLLTKNEPDLLTAVLETIGRYATVQEYNYDFGADLLPVAAFLEAVADPASFLLNPSWCEEIDSHVQSNADQMCYLLRRDRYAAITEEYHISAELTAAIDGALKSGERERLFPLLKGLQEQLEKSLFITRKELAGLSASYVLPAGAVAAVQGSSFSLAAKATAALRSLQREGLLLPRAGLEEYLEGNAATLSYALADERLVEKKVGRDVSPADYRRLALCMKNNVSVHLLPRLEEIMARFDSAAEIDPEARQAPLYHYVAALRSLRMRWDIADKRIIRDVRERLFTAGTSPLELLSGASGEGEAKWTRCLELFLRRVFDPNSQDRQWAIRGVAVGSLVGVASWFVLTIGGDSEDLIQGNFFKVLIGAVVAVTLYREWVSQAIIAVACFALWKVGNGLLSGVLLYLTIGANLMGTLGAMLGSSRPAPAKQGESLYRLNRARIDDVLQQMGENDHGR